jgi:hypothetical protein
VMSYHRMREELSSPLAQPAGGTSPVCLFSNTEVTKGLDEASFVVFSTDGEVDQEEIKAFSQLVGLYFGHVSLIVCVLVTYRWERWDHQSGDLDTSVFAPLLVFPNVLLLHLEEKDPRPNCQ